MALVDRVQAVLLKPREAWPAIAVEPETVRNLFTTYAIPFAAVPAVCRTIGLAIFGLTMPFLGHIALSPVYLVLSMVESFVIALATIYVTAQVIDALAPSFGTVKSPVQAMKVATYSYVPVSVGGIFGLFPPLAFVGYLLALYGIYQMYLGMRATMLTPAEKAVGLTAVTIIITIVAVAVVAVILNFAVAPFGPQLNLHSLTTSTTP